jgi:hypothetical protein
MTLLRIQALKAWVSNGTAANAPGRPFERACHRKINGHCNVPTSYKENTKLANWVGTQRKQYRLYLEGKKFDSPPRIQALKAWVLNGWPQHRLGRPFE